MAEAANEKGGDLWIKEHTVRVFWKLSKDMEF